MTQPRVYIDPPDVEGRRYGLLGNGQPGSGAAHDLGVVDEHWVIGGVEWESLRAYLSAQYPAGIFAPTANAGNHQVKALPDGLGVTAGWPGATYAGVDCGSVGYTDAQLRARALEILRLSREHSIESQLWAGGGANTIALNANNAATVLTGTQAAPVAVNMVQALRLLTNWVGDHYQGAAILHAKRGVAGYAAYRRLTFRDADNPYRLNAPDGTRWCFGAGYDGTGPNASVPGATQSWLYVTGAVILASGEATVPAGLAEALNRVNNREFVIAEQPHLLGIDGPWAAALVDLTAAP